MSSGSRKSWFEEISGSRKSWFASGRHSRHFEEEEALRWAAIEKLPTYNRLRISIIKDFDGQKLREVYVKQLNEEDWQKFMNGIFKDGDEDNEKFLKKLRNRIDRVGIQLPTVEVWFYFISFFSFLYFTYYGMMTVSITPNPQVAAILAASFYSLFNLFAGFFIPRPLYIKMPEWWVWYYWLCPLSWTVNGLITSQYGDDENTIEVAGIVPNPTVKWYLKHHFGFNSDFMGPIAAILVGFTVNELPSKIRAE